MTQDNQVTLIALISVLQDKGVLDRDEVSDIKKHGDLIPHLIAKGLISEEDFVKRFDEVKKVLDVVAKIIKGPVTPAMINVVRAHQDQFPGLLQGVMETLEAGGYG